MSCYSICFNFVPTVTVKGFCCKRHLSSELVCGESNVTGKERSKLVAKGLAVGSFVVIKAADCLRYAGVVPSTVRLLMRALVTA